MHQQLLLSYPVQSPPLSLLTKTVLGITVRASSSSSSSSSSASGVRELSLLPNALRRRSHPGCSGAGFSLGVDLGNSRTGLALGKGFFPRPLTVLELRGQKLESCLLDIAQKEEVDEFIIGLPKSHTGKETPQSNKVRSIAGRLAVRAAERFRTSVRRSSLSASGWSVPGKRLLRSTKAGEYIYRMNMEVH